MVTLSINSIVCQFLRLFFQIYLVYFSSKVTIVDNVLQFIIIHNIFESIISAGQDSTKKKYKFLSDKIVINTKFTAFFVITFLLILIEILGLFIFDKLLLITLFISLFFYPIKLASNLLKFTIINITYFLIAILLIFLEFDNFLLIWCFSGLGLLCISNTKYLNFKFSYKVYLDHLNFYKLILITSTYTSIPTLFVSLTFDLQTSSTIWILEKVKGLIITLSYPLIRIFTFVSRFKIDYYKILFYYFTIYFICFVSALFYLYFFQLHFKFYVLVYLLIPIPIIYSLVIGVMKQSFSSNYRKIYEVYKKVILVMILPLLFSYMSTNLLYILIVMLFTEIFVAYEFRKKI